MVLAKDTQWALVMQVIYNVVLIACGIWLIREGVEEGISQFFFLGVFTILLTAFMRYIDLVGDYVGGSLLFLGMAVVLIGAARFWNVFCTLNSNTHIKHFADMFEDLIPAHRLH